MKKNRMLLKIISYMLIQAFFCLDICFAGAGTAAVDTGTLAPSMAMNKIDLQGVFLLNDVKEDLDEDTSWGEIEKATKAEDTMAANVVPPVTTSDTATSSNIANLNMAGIEPVLPPPPKHFFVNMLSQANLRNILPYPFDKDNLEAELNFLGFELVSPEVSRKLIAYLLEVLELRDKQFVGILQGLNINKIGFKQVITRDANSRSIEIEDGILYISPEFLNDRLALRVSFLNDSIAAIASNITLVEYIDIDGNTAMASSEKLGLDKRGDDMLRDMKKIAAEYTFSPYWYGFKSFVPYQTDDPTEFMRLLRPKISDKYEYDPQKIGVSLTILPDLIKLYIEAPSLWKELVEAILAHEGGRKGHLKPWPLTNIEEIVEFFNWPELIKKTAEPLIKNFVNEIWPEDIIKRGLPPVDKWLPAAAILNLSLERFSINNNSANPDGIVWKEYQANYGMVQEKGLRAVAIWFWWLNNYRGLNSDFNKDHDQLFAFLDNNKWAEMLSMKEGIQREYEKIASGVEVVKPSISLKTTLPSIGIGLLTYISLLFVDALPVLAADSSVPTQASGIEWVVTAAAITSIAAISWLVKKSPWGKSTEKRTEQLVNQAVRQQKKDAQSVNLIKLQGFYGKSSFKDKRIIIDAIRDRILLNQGKTNSEIFEPFFINIFDLRPKNMFINLQSSVSEKDVEIAGLRFAAAYTLKKFSESGMGTGRLVEHLKNYLRTEGTNISMALENEIRDVVANLTEGSIEKDAAVEKAKKTVVDVPSSTLPASAPKIAIDPDTKSFQRRFAKNEMVESAI